MYPRLRRTDGGAEPSPHDPRTALGRADVADGFAGLFRQGAVIALEANPSFQPLHPRAAYEALLPLHNHHTLRLRILEYSLSKERG